MNMYGAQRALTIDGMSCETVDRVGDLDVETWSEFRVLRREDGSLWTLADHGVIGQFDRPPAEAMIEALDIGMVIERARMYGESYGVDVQDFVQRMQEMTWEH